MKSTDLDVVIVGGGVTGTALAYVLGRYTNVEKIALIERYGSVAEVNSHPRNNSQTLHFGDIETNYSLDHALVVKSAADLVVGYVLKHPSPGLHRLTSKMVLAVGAAEVSAMRERFALFKPHYPGLELLEASEVARLEPAVMRDRSPDQPVIALLSRDGYAINFKRLSESFVENADPTGERLDIMLNTEVLDIIRRPDGSLVVVTNSGELHTKTVAVAAGPYSMMFAQKMGYVPHLAFLPVAGSFYFSDQSLLKGKVYTVQVPELPFAAVHGDPDVVFEGQTRFGPTAKVVPMLERHRYSTMRPYMRTPIRRLAGILTLVNILRDRVIAKFIVKNFFYDWPIIGKYLYLGQMRKVVPSLKARDIKRGKGMGGLRPQIVDTLKHSMQMGDSTIVEPGIIFNTTPSPGASVALRNAEMAALEIVGFLGGDHKFNQVSFDTQLRSVS